MDQPLTVSADFAPDLEQLRLGNDLLRVVLSRAGADEKTAGEIDLALSEGLTNAIKFSGTAHGLVTLTLTLEPSLLVIRILDQGPGFDMDALESPDFDTPREGGYGVYIMRQVMDRVEYTRSEKGNELIMEKRLPSEGSSR